MQLTAELKSRQDNPQALGDAMTSISPASGYLALEALESYKRAEAGHMSRQVRETACLYFPLFA